MDIWKIDFMGNGPAEDDNDRPRRVVPLSEEEKTEHLQRMREQEQNAAKRFLMGSSNWMGS